jgi:putative holliday junction resolvase
MPERLLAIDYGEKRIGLALTDPLAMFAKPLRTIPNISLAETVRQLEALIVEKSVDRVIVGIPWSLEGTATAKTLETLDFIDKLQTSLSKPVIGSDERYTTSDANELLKEMGLNWKQAREVIDAMAACLILKRYLEKNQQGETDAQ